MANPETARELRARQNAFLAKLLRDLPPQDVARQVSVVLRDRDNWNDDDLKMVYDAAFTIAWSRI